MSLYKIKCRMSKGNMINIGVLKHSSPVSFDKILTLKTLFCMCNNLCMSNRNRVFLSSEVYSNVSKKRGSTSTKLSENIITWADPDTHKLRR